MNNTSVRTREQLRLHTRYGPWSVVTGASDGIGREIAVRLAESGLNLMLVARRREILEQLARELRQRHGIEVQILAADLSEPASIERLVAVTRDLDVGLFVASAGFGTSGAFTDSNLERELTMIDVNCRAVLALCHSFARRMVTRGRGGIVLMSSLVAFQGVPRAANYAATKAFVQTFAEGLHVELAPHGVDVLASAPGPVESGFNATANMRSSQAVSSRDAAVGTLSALGRRTTVRPGFLSAFLEAMLAPLPRWARVSIMARVMGGMTRHQAQRASDDSVNALER
jgi:uncharacterized protein